MILFYYKYVIELDVNKYWKDYGRNVKWFREDSYTTLAKNEWKI